MPVILLPHTTRGQSHSQQAKIGTETSSYPESAVASWAALSPERQKDCIQSSFKWIKIWAKQKRSLLFGSKGKEQNKRLSVSDINHSHTNKTSYQQKHGKQRCLHGCCHFIWGVFKARWLLVLRWNKKEKECWNLIPFTIDHIRVHLLMKHEHMSQKKVSWHRLPMVLYRDEVLG